MSNHEGNTMAGMRVGGRYYSTVSTAEIIVVRAADVELTCAGAPMAETAEGRSDTAAGDSTVALGKRYQDAETGLIVMVTKPGVGPLAADGRALEVASTKPLPSSD